MNTGGGLNRGKNRKFSKEELEKIEKLAAIRVSRDNIAILMSIHPEYFSELIKKNKALRHALEGGQAKSSAEFRHVIYDEAVKKRNTRLLEFWGKCHEGMKPVEAIEHSGPNGGPITTNEEFASKEEILKAIAENNELLKKEAEKK